MKVRLSFLKFLFPALSNLSSLVLSLSWNWVTRTLLLWCCIYLVVVSSGPTQDKDSIQTYHDMKAKEETAAPPNMAGLLHQFDRCWGTLTQFWMELLADRAMKHRSRGRTGRFFFSFPLAKHHFYTLEGNFHQVSLTTARLNLIKSQHPTQPPCLRLWLENSTSLSDHVNSWDHGRWGTVSDNSATLVKCRFCHSGAHY